MERNLAHEWRSAKLLILPNFITIGKYKRFLSLRPPSGRKFLWWLGEIMNRSNELLGPILKYLSVPKFQDANCCTLRTKFTWTLNWLRQKKFNTENTNVKIKLNNQNRRVTLTSYIWSISKQGRFKKFRLTLDLWLWLAKYQITIIKTYRPTSQYKEKWKYL